MKKDSNKALLLKYAGFSFQLLVILAVMVYAGWWLDGKFNFPLPLLVWILPLVTIIITIIKVIKETSKK